MRLVEDAIESLRKVQTPGYRHIELNPPSASGSIFSKFVGYCRFGGGEICEELRVGEA